MIYLLRHGETVWNAANRLQGSQDSPLTDRGLAQADRLGRRLAEDLAGQTHIDAQVSPLGRARQTAERIARHIPLAFRQDPRLVEVSFGDWEGLTRTDIAARYPADMAAPDWYFRAPGGESFEAARARVSGWLDEVRAGPAAVTVVVCHGLTGRLARGLFLGLGRAELLELPVPQDGYYRLSEGRVEYVACGE